MGEVLREGLDYPHCLKKWLRLKVVVNELDSCSKDQKKRDWKIRDKEVWDRDLLMNRWEWGQSMKTFV